MIKYDAVMDVYQGLLKKEKEQIEEEKKKKIKEVELWARSLREEEKLAIEKFAKDHGDKEMEQIAESIKEKQEKELKDKEMLSTAKDNFKAKLDEMVRQRNAEWESKKQVFLTKKMNELKAQIIEHAKAAHLKAKNLEIIKQREEERRKRDAEIAQKNKEDSPSKPEEGE